MAFDPSTPGRIHAFTGDALTELFTSSDYGRSWTPVRTAEPLLYMVNLSMSRDPSGAFLYVADGARGVVRSADGGQTWTGMTNGLPVGDHSASDLAADPVDPTIAYVAANSVFKTTNGGNSWEPRNGQVQYVDPVFFAEKIVVHPLSRNLLFTGSVTGGFVF